MTGGQNIFLPYPPQTFLSKTFFFGHDFRLEPQKRSVENLDSNKFIPANSLVCLLLKRNYFPRFDNY